MKRILLFALSLLVLACGNESSVKPANSNTFVRYFNGGNNDIAVAFAQAPDKGIVILATTQIKQTETSPTEYRIKLIKTDEYGNQQWIKFFPDFAGSNHSNYKAGGINLASDGTITIAGTFIPSIGTSQLLLINTDANGENPKTYTIPSTQNVTGTAVTLNADKEFIVLGQIDDPNVNIYVGRVKATLDSVLFSKLYGSGKVALVNKLFLDNTTNSLNWGGTVTHDQTSNANPAIRLSKIYINKESNNEGATLFDPPIGDPALSMEGHDFCRFGNNWVFVGTSQPSGGTTNMLYQQVDPSNGYVISSKTIAVDLKTGSTNLIGNAVATLKDGGLLLLGTANSTNGFGRGLGDYYLVKIDAFGTPKFKLPYGSIFDDQGVAVMQASDGGYLVLGTTNLANLKTIMLMKTDQEGLIK